MTNDFKVHFDHKSKVEMTVMKAQNQIALFLKQKIDFKEAVRLSLAAAD
jgi:hypothetical protein